MNGELQNYLVKVPDSIVGEVAGKLNNLGALLENLESREGISEIETKIPIEQVSYFKEWLEKITNGQGQLIENA